MFFSFRKERQGVDSGIRYFAGVCVNSDCKRIEIALIGLQGSGSGAAVLLQKHAFFDLNVEIANAFDSMKIHVKEDSGRSMQGCVLDSDSGSCDESASLSKAAVQKKSAQDLDADIPVDFFSGIFALREKLIPFLEGAVDSLFDGSGPSRDEIMMISFFGPDFLYQTPFGMRSIDLFDARRLAERTGLNILSAFSDKDLLAGGSGNDLLAFPYWIYLNRPDEDQLLLDLGQTARWTLIGGPMQTPVSRTIAPCGSLLDPLVLQASRGKSSMDLGGRLSVMGRKIPDLIQSWHQIADSCSGKNAALPLPFLSSLFASELVRTKNPEDILCSAVHWIAERIALQADRDFSKKGKILLTGGGKANGLLYTALMKDLLPREIVPIEDLGFPADSFDAMAAAMLGVLFFYRIALPSDRNCPRPVPGSLEFGSDSHRDLLIRGMNAGMN
ncbi:MAG: anhydro-N-acetylmuramic acid kinase [Planctomycetia bacterium]|nr:anhydro-N-acetylmuramic acid kinase [Planctomycetia bacterium]